MVTPKNLIQNSKTDLGWDTRDADYTSWRNAVKDYCAQHSIRKDDISNAGEAAGTAVVFWVCDPEIGGHRDINRWIWDERDRSRLGVIQTMTLDGFGIWLKLMFLQIERFEKYWAHSRTRTLLTSAFLPTIPVSVLTQSTPNGVTPFCTPKSQFPPRADPYFELEKFIPRNEYEDFAEDSDANVCNVAGVRRHWMPTKDHTFEQRKYELRGRVACQQETLNNIKKEHKCLFPNAGIIDSDDEGYCYIRCLKRPKITSGAQLVKARQVVAVGRWATRLNRLLGVRRIGDQEEEVEETVLQPPHIQLSKRHATLDTARPTRKVHIDYGAALILSSRVRSSPPPLSAGRGRLHTHTASGTSNTPSDRFSLDSEDHNSYQEDGPDRMAKKPSRVRPRSRSFFTIPEQYKELATRAASHVRYYTLFAHPMLDAEEIQQLLSLCSIHSRTRSHLVYECKHNIVEVFGLSKLPQHEIAEQVKCLLLEDRLICRADGQETHQRHFLSSEITDVIFHKYFASVKMRGNFNETFFDSINEVFICLVTSAMRHCLKAWTTGVYMEPPKTGDFKYDTSISTYCNVGSGNKATKGGGGGLRREARARGKRGRGQGARDTRKQLPCVSREAAGLQTQGEARQGQEVRGLGSRAAESRRDKEVHKGDAPMWREARPCIGYTRRWMGIQREGGESKLYIQASFLAKATGRNKVPETPYLGNRDNNDINQQ
ncbi:hypothetical protein BGX38DRAFT_1280801 [Terfezia claveryi]|nr:hypothetical protein BGX38DRAFT_1280801 [Terfezia claveryi]